MYAFKSFVVVSALALLVATPVLRADDTPEQARLREALRNQTAQGSTGIAPEDKPMAAPRTDAATETPAVVVTSANSASDQALRDALRQYTKGGSAPRTAEEDALRAALRGVTSDPTVEVTSTTPVTTTTVTTTPAVQTSSTTASAPATKEERLAELLRLYKSDVITPGEYHKQRAEILAGQ